jgi:hypothetical protein
MYSKTIFLSRNADLFRRLCRLPLAGYEQSLARQLENTEALFLRHCQDVKSGFPRTNSVTGSEQCPPAKRPALKLASGAHQTFTGSPNAIAAPQECFLRGAVNAEKQTKTRHSEKVLAA